MKGTQAYGKKFHTQMNNSDNVVGTFGGRRVLYISKIYTSALVQLSYQIN